MPLTDTEAPGPVHARIHSSIIARRVPSGPWRFRREAERARIPAAEIARRQRRAGDFAGSVAAATGGLSDFAS